MAMAQLVLEDSQQVRYDVQPLSQKANPLVHLQVAPYCLVHGLELGFDPEQLRRVKDGAVEVDVDAEDEELADLHVDLGAAESDFTCQGYLCRDIFAGFDSRGYELFEERRLGDVLARATS